MYILKLKIFHTLEMFMTKFHEVVRITSVALGSERAVRPVVHLN